MNPDELIPEELKEALFNVLDEPNIEPCDEDYPCHVVLQTFKKVTLVDIIKALNSQLKAKEAENAELTRKLEEANSRIMQFEKWCRDFYKRYREECGEAGVGFDVCNNCAQCAAYDFGWMIGLHNPKPPKAHRAKEKT